MIGNDEITIINIYGPNDDNPQLFHAIFSKLMDFSESAIILGDDFNAVITPDLERSNTKNNHRPWHSSDTLKQYMTDVGLGDIWRLKPPLIENTHITHLPQILF